MLVYLRIFSKLSSYRHLLCMMVPSLFVETEYPVHRPFFRSHNQRGFQGFWNPTLCCDRVYQLTDAIVVVLSEERGTIAIAQNGKIKTVVDAYELRQELQKLSQSKQRHNIDDFQTTNRIISIFTENILLKIVSLSCALTLWTWVQNQTVEEISLKALITYNYPENLSIVNIPRQSVTVLLEGPQALVRGLKETSLEVYVDSSDAAKGTTSYEFSTSSISNIPTGFRVLRISPPSIDVEFDTTMTKNSGFYQIS